MCGEDVPRGSLACPECGADHKSGWREDANTYDALDLPEDDFSYDAFVREEFGKSSKAAGGNIVYWLAAIVLIIAFLTIYFVTAR